MLPAISPKRKTKRGSKNAAQPHTHTHTRAYVCVTHLPDSNVGGTAELKEISALHFKMVVVVVAAPSLLLLRLFFSAGGGAANVDVR